MRSRRPSILAAVVAAAALALVVAACGGSSPHRSTSASGSGPPPTQAQTQQMVRFADCMRSHGVPGFPDPNADFGAFKQAVNSNSPAFASAMPHCQQLLPNLQSSESTAEPHSHTVALLAFARCLRGHGFPNFPDPSTSGQVTHEMIASAGINLQQPAVLHAADACVGVTHGVITPAIVARFVAGH